VPLLEALTNYLPDADRVAEYDMKLMDIDADTLGIPDTEYDARVTMVAGEFTRIVRDLSSLGESVRIEVSKEGVRFASDGEAAQGNILLKQTDAAREKYENYGKDDEEDEVKEEDDEDDDEEKPKKAKKKEKVKKEEGADDEDEEMANGENDEAEFQAKSEDEDEGEEEVSDSEKKKRKRAAASSSVRPSLCLVNRLTSLMGIQRRRKRKQRKLSTPQTVAGVCISR
jgi:proliferating cell nuclear antigen